MRLRLARQDVAFDLLLFGQDLMRVIRRRYSLALMNAILLLQQPARFGQLATALPQASTSTLAETLAALEAAQLSPVASYCRGCTHQHLHADRERREAASRLRRLLDDIHD